MRFADILMTAAQQRGGSAGLPIVNMTAGDNGAGNYPGYTVGLWGTLSATLVPGYVTHSVADDNTYAGAVTINTDASNLAGYGGLKINGGARVALNAWSGNPATAYKTGLGQFGFVSGNSYTLQLVP